MVLGGVCGGVSVELVFKTRAPKWHSIPVVRKITWSHPKSTDTERYAPWSHCLYLGTGSTLDSYCFCPIFKFFVLRKKEMAATEKHNVLKTIRFLPPPPPKRLISTAPHKYQLKFITSFTQCNTSPSISLLSFSPMVAPDKQALVMVHRLHLPHAPLHRSFISNEGFDTGEVNYNLLLNF